MQPQRSTPLSPAVAPLTPSDWYVTEPTTPRLSTGAKLAKLHRRLESERKANARTIRVLSRYVELLEGIIAGQRQAFEELDKPLIPAQSKRKPQ